MPGTCARARINRVCEVWTKFYAEYLELFENAIWNGSQIYMDVNYAEGLQICKVHAPNISCIVCNVIWVIRGLPQGGAVPH